MAAAAVVHRKQRPFFWAIKKRGAVGKKWAAHEEFFFIIS
jgi:hypothetical protein